MPSTSMHLVKWTFPTLAILLGLFWYRRRRADRVDPGGKSKSDSEIIKANNKNITKKIECDSGLNTDDSFSFSTTSLSPSNVDICSPRKVSSSLDIPGRKPSVTMPISMKSVKSIEERIPWYDDDDDDDEVEEEKEIVEETRKIKLGSNPRSSCFEMMSNNRPFFDKTQIESEIKLPKICDNVIEEDKVTENRLGQEMSIKEEMKSTSVPETCKKTVDVVNNEAKSQALCERDSANHSPLSAVLDGSLTDEARSEGSTDSGKGGSIKGPINNNIRTSYDFAVPLFLVGKLIGQKGSFLQSIRQKSDVRISVKRFTNMKNHKLCVIEGSPEGINLALSLIRQKFPEKKYPQFTLDQLSVPKSQDETPWISELMHLSLVEGVNNDVLVCYIVKPNRLFIQIPTHPTYPMLRTLDDNITQLYETTESPPVPEELCRGMIFVAKLYNRWMRVYVENPDPKGEQHLVRLVDHGGYWTLSSADMRKIRSDYLTLPFQAIEVFLANVRPVNGVWQQEAFDLVSQICSGIVGQAQIEGYVDSHTYVSLYLTIQKHGVISLADELIARGYAEPSTLEEVMDETELPYM